MPHLLHSVFDLAQHRTELNYSRHVPLHNSLYLSQPTDYIILSCHLSLLRSGRCLQAQAGPPAPHCNSS
jgi:hypothetical protein